MKNQLKCGNCGRSAKMFWKDVSMRNGFSETFYTAPNGKTVCRNCYIELSGSEPRSLKELNDERKKD